MRALKPYTRWDHRESVLSALSCLGCIQQTPLSDQDCNILMEIRHKVVDSRTRSAVRYDSPEHQAFLSTRLLILCSDGYWGFKNSACKDNREVPCLTKKEILRSRNLQGKMHDQTRVEYRRWNRMELEVQLLEAPKLPLNARDHHFFSTWATTTTMEKWGTKQLQQTVQGIGIGQKAQRAKKSKSIPTKIDIQISQAKCLGKSTIDIQGTPSTWSGSKRKRLGKAAPDWENANGPMVLIEEISWSNPSGFLSFIGWFICHFMTVFHSSGSGGFIWRSFVFPVDLRRCSQGSITAVPGHSQRLILLCLLATSRNKLFCRVKNHKKQKNIIKKTVLCCTKGHEVQCATRHQLHWLCVWPRVDCGGKSLGPSFSGASELANTRFRRIGIHRIRNICPQLWSHVANKAFLAPCRRC